METKDILKQLREKNNYSIKDVANGTKMQYTMCREYESGDRRLGMSAAIKFADFYNVSIDYLLGRPDAAEPVDPVDEFAQREHLKTLEKLFMQKYLNLTSEQRDKVLDFLREIVADEAAAAAEEARNNMEIVRTAARKPTADNAPHTEAYPKELLDEMDRTAPRTDSDM